MKIYNYHPETLAFVGSSDADRDPLIEGNWLMPANATAIAPPEAQEGKTTHFENGVWVQKDIPVPVEAPPPELTYADRRAREYPPAADYMDGIVKGDQAQVQAYIDACLAVKAKYPKPSDQ